MMAFISEYMDSISYMGIASTSRESSSACCFASLILYYRSSLAVTGRS